MIRFLYFALVTAWSLWFGGMIALLIFVTRLFKASHDTGVIAAPVLFRTFAVYQLVVGAIVVLVALILWIRSRSKSRAVVMILLAISLILAVPIRAWTDRIESLRAAGQSQSAEFKSAHARSSIAYSTSAVSLLCAGVGISLAGAKHRK